MTQLIAIIVILMIWVVIELIRNCKLQKENENLFMKNCRLGSYIEYKWPENKIDERV